MLPSSPQPPRINLFHFKSQIEKKLGPDKSIRYFNNLNDFLSERLSKPGFSKFCSKIFGQENIHLHNKLIRAILKNACFAKTPPLQRHHRHDKGFVKPSPVKQPGDKDKKSSPPALDDGFQAPQPTTSGAPFWSSNGDISPQSPWRSRSGVRKLKNTHTAFGPNGKTNIMPPESLLLSNPTVRENGSLMAPREFNDNVAESPSPSKKPRIDKPSLQYNQITKWGKDVTKVMAPVKGGRDVEYIKDVRSSWGPLQAPLGVPFCPASVGGAQRSSPFSICGISSSSGNGANNLSNCSSGELCHTDDLKNRLDRMVETHDVGSVTNDCANVLNKAVDSYLIRLIKPCVDLVRAKSEQRATRHAAVKKQPNGKLINGVLPGNHTHVHNIGSLEGSQYPRSPRTMSVLDFMLAMNLNPQLLGEDFPSLREKIHFCSFEEE